MRAACTREEYLELASFADHEVASSLEVGAVGRQDYGVARIFAREDAGNGETFGQLGRRLASRDQGSIAALLHGQAAVPLHICCSSLRRNTFH